MALKYRRTLIIIALLISIFISFFCFYLGYQNYLEPKLGNFQIQEVISKEQMFYLKITPSHNAIKYHVNITNQKGEKIFETTSTETEIPLKGLIANYGDDLKVQVLAENKTGTQKSAEIFNYHWNHASFINFNSRYLNTSTGLSLLLYGYLQDETYTVKLEYLNEMIYQKEITSDNVFVPYEVIGSYAGRITAKLYQQDQTLIHAYNFYVNTPQVGKIHLDSPVKDASTRWDDITFSITGGENATNYRLYIYEEEKLTNTIELPVETKSYTLPATFLNEEKNYTFTIEAAYKDYQEIFETDTLHTYVGKKETTKPVSVSHNPDYIKKGTEVTLHSRNSDATIYYTTDGSTPSTKSKVYSQPISITEDVTINTYAVSKNRYDSEVNHYDFHIGEKNLVIYLSPSNQYLNYGVRSVGYTNEMREMNNIANIVADVLKENGVTVYKNRSSGNINEWLRESNYVKSDLHLAIHSNASSTNEARGIEIYIDDATSKSLSIATHIYENLYQIYPARNEAYTNRGIKYAYGSLGEVNDNYISCGALIEIAYHDNAEDAKWMVENREEIGNNIAQSILSYYN